MLEALHFHIYDVASRAVDPVPVVWAPYRGQRCEYPWVALQLISGPTSLRTSAKVAQPVTLTVTVEPGNAGDQVSARFGCLFVETTHTGDPVTTAVALADAYRCLDSSTSLTVAGASITVDEPVFSGEGVLLTSAAVVAAGNPVYMYEMRREFVFQVTTYATDPRGWAPTGALKVAQDLQNAFQVWDGDRQRMSLRPRELNQQIVFPRGKSESETQVLFELDASFTETIVHSGDTFDCVDNGAVSVTRLS